MTSSVLTKKQTDIIEHIYYLALFEELKLTQSENRANELKHILAHRLSSAIDISALTEMHSSRETDTDSEIYSYFNRTMSQKDEDSVRFAVCLQTIGLRYTDDIIHKAFEQALIVTLARYPSEPMPHPTTFRPNYSVLTKKCIKHINEQIAESLKHKQELYAQQFSEDCGTPTDPRDTLAFLLADRFSADNKPHMEVVLDRAAKCIFSALEDITGEDSDGFQIDRSQEEPNEQ